ncbi:MAG: hypothetical protein TR69_WS6001001229 [candidate division WS6 bacterium OLB20]|uniref:Uncharacterized protein n=1 Tax=candidate division WS6 bacterium OLB20 TaxID=1617426 RepID=A0A136LX54_9BACT|nr:MAG: hypothetical protein TR69_WS6001001229 [candidate division WS6 bacterium OLB20]
MIYAAVITNGFWFLISLLENLPDHFYVGASVILYAVFLFELYSTKYYAQRLLDQFALPQVDEKDRTVHLIHHVILPSVTYWSFIVFTFFNHQRSLQLPLLAIIFVTFAVLFTNIRAYYEDKFKLEQYTHSIYDMLMLIVLFIATDANINLFGFLGSRVWISSFFIIAAFLVMAALTLVRYHVLLRDAVAMLVTWGALAISTLLILQAFYFQPFAVSFLFTLLLYYFIALLHHRLDMSLSWKVISEYVVVFLIFIVLLFGVA